MLPLRCLGPSLALVAFVLAPARASAQPQPVPLPRWRVEAEGGLSGIYTSPQSDQYGLGGVGALRLRLRLAGGFGVHVAGQFTGWSASETAGAGSSLYGAGVGLHWMPRMATGVLLLDAEIGLMGTGKPVAGNSSANLGVVPTIGVGFLFRAASILDFGPVARVGVGYQVAGQGDNDRREFGFWSVGLAFSFHPPPDVPPAAPPPAPPPDEPTLTPTAVRVDASHLVLSERVLFEVDSDRIDGASHRILDEVVDTLRGHPELTHLQVEGHTDESGDAAHNQQLSLDRARSVVRYLTDHGIASSRLDAIGYGDTRPLDRRGTPEARLVNRRVEFVIASSNETPSAPIVVTTPAAPLPTTAGTAVEASPTTPAPASEPEEGGRGHHHHHGHHAGGHHAGGHHHHGH